MKHNLKITTIILIMFILAQFIGICLIKHYSSEENKLPYGMEAPEISQEKDFYTSFFPSIVIAFIFAILLLILLTKFKLSFVLRLWFFIVILIAIGVFFNAILPNGKFTPYIALIFALPFAIIKIFKRNFLIHNLTELIIYPSIACVFVPLLNLWTIVFLLVLISVYDMWAVWSSGIMQKMAKYQINELKIFSGFFIPYISKKQKEKIIKIKKESPKKLEKQKIRAQVAILGGGDVVFPIIASGVMFSKFGFFGALFVIIGATAGLGYLMLMGEKKKFYPAMPFISTGIFLGMLLSWLIL